MVLVEVLWKMVAVILYHRMGTAIKFHYVIHVFWGVHGMVTASFEGKLLQQLMSMRE